MAVTLRIEADTLSAEALLGLTRELSAALNRETEVRATMATAPTGPGAKGDGAVLNSIVLEVLAHGAGTVLGHTVLLVLGAFFARVPDLKAILKDDSIIELYASEQGQG